MEPSQASGERRHTLAREVERVIVWRIAGGEYPPGSRLPTCEQLGRELRANKNTISKVYQALGRQGYTVSRPGHGTFVVQRPPEATTDNRSSEALRIFADAVAQASLTGVSGGELETLALETIRRHFSRSATRIGYVDCTPMDAREIGGQLEAALAATVEPLVIDDVVKHVETVASTFDVLAVCLDNYGVLQRRIQTAGVVGGAEVVPAVSLPDPSSLTQVARLPAGTGLLVVSDTSEVLHALTGLALGSNPAIHVSSLLSADRHLPDAVTSADAILVTRTAHRRIAALGGPGLTIVATFRLDPESVVAVADAVARLQPRALERAEGG